MSIIRRSLPLLSALLVGAGFLVTARSTLLIDPTYPLLLAVPPLVLSMMIMAMSSLIVGKRVVLYHRLRMAVTPVALIIGGYGYFIILESPITRSALAFALMGIVLVYFRRVARMASFALSEKAEFAWFTYALHVAASFLVFAAAYGLSRLVHPPISALAAVVACILIAITFETLRRYGIGARHSAPLAVAIGVMATELFAAISLLPTGYLANATVMMVLFALALRVAMQVMGHKGDTKGLKRQTMVSFALVIILLVTSRWI